MDSNTKLYCIFGSPVRHSLSPVMHNAAFKEKNLNAVYLAFEPQGIESAVNAMRALGIQGASVTIPFKIDLLNYVDECDFLAREIGSANTILFKDDILKAYNTDGTGALLALQELGIDVKHESICVLGNGGSARAILYALQNAGARCAIAGRNIQKVNQLADELLKLSQVDRFLINELTPDMTSAFNIIINTTPVGMTPDSARTPFQDELLHSHQTVFDIIYSPLETRLLREASAKGCRTLNGIEMLVQQGAAQFKIWTEMDAPVEIMRKSILSHLDNNGL